MIRFIKTKRVGQQIHFIIRIDARAANIRNRDEKLYAEINLNVGFIVLVKEIKEDTDYGAEDMLRSYLRDELFTHYVDMFIINGFIKHFKTQATRFIEEIRETGFNVIYKYKNHPWKEEDEDNERRWKK